MTTDSGADIATSVHRGDMLAAISNAIVRLYKEHFGKGPTKARTYMHGDVITCVLRGGLTRAEQTLIDSGYGDAVVRGRTTLQQVTRDRFVEAIEEITGRRVIGFMSGTQQDPEMNAEVFVLDAPVAVGADSHATP